MLNWFPGTTWYIEYINPELQLAYGLRQLIYKGKSQYQSVQIIETGPFGRSLVLDNKTQSSEADEFVYHESLVQPVMAAFPNPKRVFIAGGGEGATAREVLRHNTVTEVVMVDLDKEVVDLCKQYLPKHHAGAFEDKRLKLYHDDALKWLKDEQGKYDVIVIDIPDPLEGGPAYLLYTQEFYHLIRQRLNPGGLMVAQCGPAGPINYQEVYTAVYHTMASVFPKTFPYRSYVPSFGSTWGFIIGAQPEAPDLPKMTAAEIDKRLADRKVAANLRYYDGEAHAGLFSLPKYIRQGFKTETRLITNDKPLYSI